MSKVTKGNNPGFISAVGLTTGTTRFAIYPGVGLEAYAGPVGIRAEVGDDILLKWRSQQSAD